MYIVSPHPQGTVHSSTGSSSMLALNVDRLVGHSNCPKLSPIQVESSLSSPQSHSQSPSPISMSMPMSASRENNNCYNSHGHSPTPTPSPPQNLHKSKSPSHFSKISLLLNNNNNNNNSANAMISTISNNNNNPNVVKEEWNSEDESHESESQPQALGIDPAPASCGDENASIPIPVEVKISSISSCSTTSGLPDENLVDMDDSSEISPKRRRPFINHPHPHHHYHYQRDNNNDTVVHSHNSSIDEDHHQQLVNNNHPNRPPSRPPSESSSSASGTGSTISCTSSSVSPCSGGGLFSQPQSHNSFSQSSTVHRFSISAILQPEFGQRAIEKIRFNNFITTLNNGTPGGKRLKTNTNSNLPLPRDSSSERSSSNLKRSRPSSVKNHSEDSNSSCTSGRSSRKEEIVDDTKVNPEVPKGPLLWPAWVYCTRYSDRPSSGPRSRRIVRKAEGSADGGGGGGGTPRNSSPDEKRPRTAFTAEQLGKLKKEFDENRYLTEKRRQDLARDLKLHENQIKIWFQNKRAKLKKSTGQRNGLALQLMAQGLYNHSTVPMDEDDDYIPC